MVGGHSVSGTCEAIDGKGIGAWVRIMSSSDGVNDSS